MVFILTVPQTETLFLYVSKLWDYFWFDSLVGDCVPKHNWVLFHGNGKLMQLWSYDASWSARKQSAVRKSVVYIFPRKEVDPNQNAVTSYSKDNSKKPKVG